MIHCLFPIGLAVSLPSPFRTNYGTAGSPTMRDFTGSLLVGGRLPRKGRCRRAAVMSWGILGIDERGLILLPGVEPPRVCPRSSGRVPRTATPRSAIQGWY